MTRRLLILLFCAAGLFGADNLKPLTIIHTNDLHAKLMPGADGRGGFAYLAEALRREKQGCTHCIVLNCGDLVQGSPVSSVYKGVPIYEIANLMGFDVATLGNHEFDYGPKYVDQYIKIAKYPVVMANMVDDGKPYLNKPYVIVNVGGMRVAVIGAMTTDLFRLQLPATLGKIRALPVAASIRPYVAELKQKSDVIILLAHLTAEDEEDVRKNLPEVQIVIGGHIHTGFREIQRSGDQWLARVQANGVEFGRIDLKVDVAKKHVESAEWRRVTIDSKTMPPAADVAKAIAGWDAKVSAMMDIPIGEAKRTLQKSDLKLMIERALCDELGVDLGFMGTGGIRDILPQGTILVRHIWNIFPFDNMTVMGKFKGSQLPPSVTTGKQIDPAKDYTLATNEFAAANQSNVRELNTTGMDFPKMGPLQRDLIIEWIKKKKVIE